MDLQTMRHSCAHLFAYALREIYPDVELTIGPAIEHGFYYDIDMEYQLKTEDLPKIEKRMKKLKTQFREFISEDVSIDEAIHMMQEKNWKYKVEMAQDLKEKGETIIRFYRNIDKDGKVHFEDMCQGPHIENMNQIGAFRLQKLAGAYWRGDEKNKMLQRIYGLCFLNDEDLEAHEKMLQEAEKRDHRKLGKELDLFSFDEEVGPGLPLWLPRGAIVVEELEKLAKEKEHAQGYLRVRTPHLAKEDLYLKSGHLPYYADSMYAPMEMDNTRYYLKAMNCPHHHKIYASRPKSYRDLPLRLAEYGTCYRHEDSGALFGLMRVRSLCMNDAHIYCTEEQFEEEFGKVIDLYLQYFKIFAIEKYQMRLSKHAASGLGKKYVNEPELWKITEEKVRAVLLKFNVPFVEVEDEAAFYGPKIDVQIWSVIGREFTLATNQLDFAVPARFNLTYKDRDGSEKTPLCIHRAPLSTHERMVGFLIEHFAGAFPLWLAPEQVRILPVSDTFIAYAEEIALNLQSLGIRAEIDSSSESLGKKIRNAELYKIPRMMVIGQKELDEQVVSVRNYFTKETEVSTLESFAHLVQSQIASRTLEILSLS